MTFSLSFISLLGVSHGCINLRNILLSDNGVAKIWDFGLTLERGIQESSLDPEGQLTVGIGTRIFMSPESRPGRPYNTKVL